jgi:hypothetical protein
MLAFHDLRILSLRADKTKSRVLAGSKSRECDGRLLAGQAVPDTTALVRPTCEGSNAAPPSSRAIRCAELARA